MRVLALGFTASLLAGTGGAQVDEPAVIVATRFPVSVSRIGNALTVIDAGRLRRLRQPQLADALRRVPGLDIVRSGGSAGVTSAFLRGGESNHVLVVVDGIALNDPNTGALDLADLPADGVERVEILRGPQSVLYGSEAVGGVIHIVTRPASGFLRARGHVEGGSARSVRGGMEFSGSAGPWGYAAQLLRQRSDGHSTTDGAPERDGFHRDHANLRLQWQPVAAGGLSLKVLARYTDAKADLDDLDLSGRLVDDTDYRQRRRSWGVRAEAGLARPGAAWQQRLGLDLTGTELRFRNGPAETDSFFEPSASRLDGRRASLSWQHALHLPHGQRTSLGWQSEMERIAAGSRSAWNHGLWLQHEARLGSGYAIAGIRLDRYQGFGVRPDWRLSLTRPLSAGWRLRGSAGTGLRAPTLGERFGAGFGNPELVPERSLGWDLGVDLDRPSAKKLRLAVTGFEQQYSDLIEYSFTERRLLNAGRARARGVECSAALEPWPSWRLELDYTWKRTANRETRESLLRRPRHSLGLLAERSGAGGGEWVVSARHVGRRRDVEGIGLPSYTIFDAAYSLPLADRLSGFLRLDNVFDRNYQEIVGYAATGRSVYVGLELAL